MTGTVIRLRSRGVEVQMGAPYEGLTVGDLFQLHRPDETVLAVMRVHRVLPNGVARLNPADPVDHRFEAAQVGDLVRSLPLPR